MERKNKKKKKLRRKRLNPKKLQVLHLIMGGSTAAAACREIGIKYDTFHQWFLTDPVQDLLYQLQDTLISQTTNQLLDLTRKSFKRLGLLIESRDERIALDAAKHATGLWQNMLDRKRVEERLERLESMHGQGKIQ